MKYLLFILALLVPFIGKAQSISWTTLADMPEAVSNNAVTEAVVDGVPYIYSFAGIDKTKDWAGVHLKAFRFDTELGVWDTIPSLPDPAGGKIAAGASTVKNKIYIIGGYHVASDYTETSSNKVHVFNPETNTYEADGTPIPMPIDDQVQAVWRDSLIFVVSGWSNTANVRDVQIYNPSTDTWMAGTPVPNSASWKVFGGSGVIIGDTIYYAGGAKSVGNFGPTLYFRKGAINPNDPTQITWIGESSNAAIGYRMAAASFDGQPFWVGGSADTYNFDGIAYNGSGGVAPLGRLLGYNPGDGQLTSYEEVISPVMDLRGIAQISGHQYIVAGGMTTNQEVSRQTQLITIDYIQQTDDIDQNETSSILYPNPVADYLDVRLEGDYDVKIFNLLGQEMMSLKAHTDEIDVRSLSIGSYCAVFWQKGEFVAREKFVVER